jgi:hypothetical protein
MSTFKLTIAVGLGLLGAAGIGLMPGGSTQDSFLVQEARADEPDGGTGGNQSDSTWGNGITGLQFKNFAPLLCSSSTPALKADQGGPSAPFAKRMDDGDFRHWFQYVVRDGAPAGTILIGKPAKPPYHRIAYRFQGGGGLSINWLNKPLTAVQRSQVLAATAAFVNDGGPETIARYCKDCSGNDGKYIKAVEGGVSSTNPKVTAVGKAHWLLELAFVGACTPLTINSSTPVPAGPKVHVFWSEQLRQKLRADKGNMQKDLEGRVCSDVYSGQVDPSKCPFAVKGSMEDSCTMDPGGTMTCKVGNVSKEAVYTFIEPKLVKPKSYRLPLVQVQKPAPELNLP